MKITTGNLVKAVLILFCAACCLLLIPIKLNIINHFILSPFEKKFAATIQFKTSRIWLPGNILLEGVSASDKGGMVCQAATVNINYNIAAMLLGKKEMLFSAKDIKFYKDVGLLNSVSRVLTMPTIPNVDFNTIEGDFDFQKDAVLIKKAAASNMNIVISGDGLIKKDGTLDCNVHFSFNKSIVDTIPDIIKTTLLSNEKDGWMGITLKTAGNYAKPSLRINSDMFQLNIKETILKVK